MREVIDFSNGWDFMLAEGGTEWQKVDLPHCAVVEAEVIGTPWSGECVYCNTFFAPEAWRGKMVYLEVGGAMQTTKIFVNDLYQFTHFGGYQRFLVPLDGAIAIGGENSIRLEIDNRPTADVAPAKRVADLDFCYHSGLYREVKLHVYESVHISDELGVSIEAGGGVFIRTTELAEKTAKLSLQCHVLHEIAQSRRFVILDAATAESKVGVKVDIIAPDGSVIEQLSAEDVDLMPNCDRNFCFDLTVDEPSCWSPESPALYQAVFRVFCNGKLSDSRTERFGIRTIEFTRDAFWLNGKAYDLIGANRHMEYPFVGNAVPPNAHKRDAKIIKNGGYNFVRLAHYNQHSAFLDSCDELGLLVIAPIPGWQQYHSNEHFLANTFRDCRELVRTLRNRPSVMLWEVSLNESYPPCWINREFHRITHAEYPGDQCFTCGDTLGLFEEWDVLFYHDRLNADKPIIIREYGDWSFGGNLSTSRQRRGNGVEALLLQTWNFMWSLNVARQTPNVVGTADWVMFDYNRGYHHDIERSGSTDIYRYPKPKYFFYQSQNHPEPMLHAVRCGGRVIVFSNCDKVAIYADSRLLARQKPDSGADSAYGVDGERPGWESAQTSKVDCRCKPFDGGNAGALNSPPFTFGDIAADIEKLTVIGYRNGGEVIRQALCTPGEAVKLRIDLRTEGIAIGKGDLVFADVLLLDLNDTIVPATAPVTLRASGEVEVIGGMAETEAGVAGFLVRVRTPGAFTIHAACTPDGIGELTADASFQ